MKWDLNPSPWNPKTLSPNLVGVMLWCGGGVMRVLLGCCESVMQVFFGGVVEAAVWECCWYVVDVLH